jgi:hypothetical protein
MFKLFSQLDSDPSARYGGYGVGLFICQRLLQLLKGSVTALSDGKTGSTFTVTIPVKKGSIKDSNSLNPFLRRIPELNPQVKDRVVIFWLSRQASKRMFYWSFSSVSGFKYLVSPTSEEGEKDFVNLLTNTPTLDMMVIDFGFLETVQRVLKEGPLGEKVKNAPLLVMTFVHKWKALRKREGVQPLFKPIQPIKSAQIICNILLSSNKSQVVSPAPAIPIPAPALDPNRPLTVLVVEDNVVNNKLLCTVLASAKVASRSAVNGQDAIEIVEREGNKIDAILMDVMVRTTHSFVLPLKLVLLSFCYSPFPISSRCLLWMESLQHRNCVNEVTRYVEEKESKLEMFSNVLPLADTNHRCYGLICRTRQVSVCGSRYERHSPQAFHEVCCH